MTQTQTQKTKGSKSSAQPRANAGNIRQRLRLWSGLILFAFCLSHFSNHALGIVSVEAMEAASKWHYWVWRSLPGELILCAAALTHIVLALWRTGKRNTLKMPAWEFIQLVLGLYIPWTLIPHVVTTMGLAKEFGFAPTYHQMLTLLWPDLAFTQSLLLLVVWIHAMIGLHFWLRLYPLYQRLKYGCLALAIALPVLALWGFVEGARRLALTKDVQVNVTREQALWVYDIADQLRAVVFGLIAVALLAVLIRYARGILARKISVGFPGGLSVRAQPGATLLEISRMNDIPLASVCGGRARCSTCRVKVLSGAETLDTPVSAETAVLRRINAAHDVRLACQVRPRENLSVQPLVAVKSSAADSEHLKDAYYWGVEQEIAVMFVDLRNFTGLTETQLAYDIVHLLNRYLDQASEAIRAEGGFVDKFIGDGIMAIFGMDSDLKTGAKQALAASRRLEKVMNDLNHERGPQFQSPLRLGVGVHVGSAILGRVGAAGSDGSKGGLTALGDVVNTASRLEAENKRFGSFLVVSTDVAEAAGVMFPDAQVSEIIVRGKEKPLKVLAIHSLDVPALSSAGDEQPSVDSLN
ncbi:adenylate/guanylate cyclase domain-containing protein [Roseibium denhamense]|uniref:Adenylate cyclase n=1 Tax=Roseibium denhamense TaxID=76305 RepID=A0ABY1PC53_9HYPH|nr:adenylate/guanylate cyclase domain-containing protein [Roseibium denhamense]MTI04569.1 adenylate/guanylate cyclase domain-containing protein [Roseibium denhamense]SMP31182.1 adenylate cyclase [Roseibium denhamense]